MLKPPSLLLTLSILLLAGCVPKARYDESLAYTTSLHREIEAVREAEELARHQGESLEAALAGERDRSARQAEVIEQLRADSKRLAENLDEATATLADMSTDKLRDRRARDEMAQLLDSMEQDQLDAQARAAAAAERIDAMAAQRETLLQEQERLEAEQAALKAKAGGLQSEADRLRAEREALATRTGELEAETERLRAEREALAAKTEAYDSLVGELQQEIADGEVTITELSGKLTVSLSNAILFASGSTALKKEGQAALQRVAGVLAGVTDREVRVEGHTDNVPVGSGARFADNWALSALRASTVVTLLVDGGVDPLNIAALGRGEFQPVQPNDTAQGRAANRRIEIVLVPKLATAGEVTPTE